jgi:hypothetical protein
VSQRIRPRRYTTRDDGTLAAGNSIAADGVAQINFPRLEVNGMGMNTAHTALAIDRVADLQAMLWSLVHEDGHVSPQERRVLDTAREVSVTLELADWNRRASASFGSIGGLSPYLQRQKQELDRRWAEIATPQTQQAA